MATGERHAQRSRRLFGRAARLAGLSASLALLAASSAAGSVLYYQSGGAIDRLDLSASHSPSQIIGARAIGDGVSAMTVSGPYLYWSDFDGLDRSSIWRARLDGSDTRALIHMRSSGPHGPVIAGGHIYWSETNAIARANLDGSHVQRAFKRLALQSSGEATDGLATDGRYIYFSRCQDAAIGRVALNGSEANPDFIALARRQCPQGIALAGGQIYWANLGLEGPGTIGRTSLAAGGEAKDAWLEDALHPRRRPVVARRRRRPAVLQLGRHPRIRPHLHRIGRPRRIAARLRPALSGRARWDGDRGRALKRLSGVSRRWPQDARAQSSPPWRPPRPRSRSA